MAYFCAGGIMELEDGVATRSVEFSSGYEAFQWAGNYMTMYVISIGFLVLT